jgi:hypothetical protein
MSVDGASQYPGMMEEIDSGEVEGKTKMAFAKMQVPQNLRESYLLTDADFDQPREDAEDREDDVAGGGGQSPSSAPPGRLPSIDSGGSAGDSLESPNGERPLSAKSNRSATSRSSSEKRLKSLASGGGGAGRLSASGPLRNLDPLSPANAAGGASQLKKSKSKRGKAVQDSSDGDIPLGEKAASLGLYN